ncbi:peptidase domain-containing ABC transporter [Pelosinus sp. sgz500959]|uniref:peptidase domain-containing ABC transporter n=1 Tax=Pelosinus sp. sgz500959 TaxID=3242472 RepID=UPI00366E56C6
MTSEMQQELTQPSEALRDTAITCVGMALRSLGRTVSDQEVRLAWPKEEKEEQNIIQALKKHKLQVYVQTVDVEQLPDIPVPAITRIKNGHYIAVGQCNGERIMVVDPLIGRPVYVPLSQFLQAWDGTLITIEQPFSLREWLRKMNLDWFISIISQYKDLLGETLIAAFFLQLLGLLMPLFTQVIVDKVLPNNGLVTLDVLAGSFLLMLFFQTLTSILRTYLFNHTTNKIDVILGIKLFRQIVSLPLQYFESRRVGDTLIRVAALNSVRDFLTGPALGALLDIFFSFIFLGVMIYYSVSMTIISLLVVPLSLLQNIVITPIYQKKLETVWAASALSNSFLVEAITGIHTMKSLAIEPQFVHRWEKLLSRYVQTAFDTSVFNLILSNTSNLIQSMVGFAVLWYGAYSVMEGDMTIGQLIAFQMMASQATGTLMKLFALWPSVQQVAMAVMRLGDVISAVPETAHSPSDAVYYEIQGDIILENIDFRYRLEGKLILDQVNIHIPQGARVGIVGRSGSGKSTLTKLIQRLYFPESGRILLDGIDLRQLDVNCLRRQIGVVLQENYLFTGSVRDNISMAAASTPIDKVIAAAKAAGAHDFILELAEGYDTPVGERGMSLSGGQKQRIAIARALITNPKILIFDEATSALDYESEKIILDNLDTICAGRTVLMIAHRLSTVHCCDLIIVLDHGKVIESGNHDELMVKKGLYYNLYLQQEG